MFRQIGGQGVFADAARRALVSFFLAILCHCPKAQDKDVHVALMRHLEV